MREPLKFKAAHFYGPTLLVSLRRPLSHSLFPPSMSQGGLGNIIKIPRSEITADVCQ